MKNNWQRAETIIIECADFHTPLGLIIDVLVIGDGIADDKKFANSIACLAVLTHGYHDSQAAFDLRANQHYVQARGIRRSTLDAFAPIVLHRTFTAGSNLGIGREVLPSEWFQTREDVAGRISPNFEPISTDWALHYQAHEALINRP